MWLTFVSHVAHMPSSDFGMLVYDWKNFPNFKVLLPTLLN